MSQRAAFTTLNGSILRWFPPFLPRGEDSQIEVMYFTLPPALPGVLHRFRRVSSERLSCGRVIAPRLAPPPSASRASSQSPLQRRPHPLASAQPPRASQRLQSHYLPARKRNHQQPGESAQRETSFVFCFCFSEWGPPEIRPQPSQRERGRVTSRRRRRNRLEACDRSLCSPPSLPPCRDTGPLCPLCPVLNCKSLQQFPILGTQPSTLFSIE